MQINGTDLAAHPQGGEYPSLNRDAARLSGESNEHMRDSCAPLIGDGRCDIPSISLNNLYSKLLKFVRTL